MTTCPEAPEAIEILCALLRDGREATPEGQTVDSLLVRLLGESDQPDGSEIGTLFLRMIRMDHDRLQLKGAPTNPALDRLIDLIGKYYAGGTLYPRQMRMARLILFRFNTLGEDDYLPELVGILNSYHMGHIKHLLPNAHPRAAGLLRQIADDLPNLIRTRRIAGPFLINLLTCCELHAPHLTRHILRPAIDLIQKRANELGGIAPGSILAATAQICVRFSAPPTPYVKKSKSDLRIAVCVSGQLRGYRKAFPTWDRFGLDPGQITYFVHSWAHPGRKQFLPAHAARCIGGATLEVYNRLFLRFGDGEIRARYPSLLRLFDGNGQPVTADELRDFYGTDHVVVEDDTKGAFATYNNSMKMYYKISAAHRLAQASGEKFDFYIRMRPDNLFKPGKPIDWDAVQELTGGTRKVIVEHAPLIYPNAIAAMCDLIAFGDRESMDAYASTWEFAQALFQGQDYLGFPHVYEGHETLFWSCFYRGVSSIARPGLFELELCDPDKPPAAAIRDAFAQDIAVRTADAYDRELLEAARQDAASP